MEEKIVKYLQGPFKKLVKFECSEQADLHQMCDAGNLDGVRQLLPEKSESSIIALLRTVLDETIDSFSQPQA